MVSKIRTRRSQARLRPWFLSVGAMICSRRCRLFLLCLLAKIKGARIAIVFPIHNTISSASGTNLFGIYSWIQRLCLLDAFSADGCFELVAGKKACSALVAFKAVHASFWLPAIEYAHPISIDSLHMKVFCSFSSMPYKDGKLHSSQRHDNSDNSSYGS